MVVTDMLSNALDWTYRQMHYYKTNEQLQTAYNLLQQAVYEAERQQQAEEIKALRLENELQAQRERLGRDLHDGLGSQLTHIISRQMNQTLRETIWLLDHETIIVAIFGTRLYGLLLKIWDDREAPALRWQLLNIPENPVLPPLIALHLIRITQEATNNALKYAHATRVSLTLAVRKKDLTLTIADNGLGFKTATTGQGFGLSNMRKRAEEVQGNFKMQTGTSGTTIKVVLPLTI